MTFNYAEFLKSNWHAIIEKFMLESKFFEFHKQKWIEATSSTLNLMEYTIHSVNVYGATKVHFEYHRGQAIHGAI